MTIYASVVVDNDDLEAPFVVPTIRREIEGA